MTEDILYISCDRCGKPTGENDIYVDYHENTICIDCHNRRVWKSGYSRGFALSSIIWIAIFLILLILMREP